HFESAVDRSNVISFTSIGHSPSGLCSLRWCGSRGDLALAFARGFGGSPALCRAEQQLVELSGGHDLHAAVAHHNWAMAVAIGGGVGQERIRSRVIQASARVNEVL